MSRTATPVVEAASGATAELFTQIKKAAGEVPKTFKEDVGRVLSPPSDVADRDRSRAAREFAPRAVPRCSNGRGASMGSSRSTPAEDGRE